MLLHTLPGGDKLYRRDQALIVRFAGRRDALSTAAYNGSYQRGLTWVFNHDCKIDGRKDTPLIAPTYEEHMRLVAQELSKGFTGDLPDPALACGLSTAADMENVSVKTETYEDLTVTAVVTGGIDCNGGRVGDPAGWHERGGESVPALGGTINILLFIGANLPAGTLTRALVTCTEAKTAALQELLAPSLYSSGIATGSGTDGTIVVSNPESPLTLTYAGKHAKLGELIGRAVMAAVKEALYLQTGLSPAQQFNIFSRIGRFGVTKESLLSKKPGIDAGLLDALSRRNDLVVLTSLYVHLLDQLQWGLLSAEDAEIGARALLCAMSPGYAANIGAAPGSPIAALCAAYTDAIAALL